MRLQSYSSNNDIDELKKFSKWILGIGDGVVGKHEDYEIKVTIQKVLLVETTSNPIADIVTATYPIFLENKSMFHF